MVGLVLYGLQLAKRATRTGRRGGGRDQDHRVARLKYFLRATRRVFLMLVLVPVLISPVTS